LTPLDPAELAAAVTGQVNSTSPQPVEATDLTREDAERQQGIWWYLLLTGVVLLATETELAVQTRAIPLTTRNR
jgi:hypothetical protein